MGPLAFWLLACVGFGALVLLTTALCRAASKPTPNPSADAAVQLPATGREAGVGASTTNRGEHAGS